MKRILKVGDIYINRFDYFDFDVSENVAAEIFQIIDNTPYVTDGGICFKTKIIRESYSPHKDRQTGKVVLTNGDCIAKQFKINKLKGALLYGIE